MKRVLAFFGAFNPPTVAHLALAQYAMERTGREGVAFVPSKAAYIRQEQGKSFAYTDAQRLAMLSAAAQTRPWMQVIPWELEAEIQPRTYHTLCQLRDSGLSPTLLLGSDKLQELEKGWQFVPEICREFGIVCLARGGNDCREALARDPFLHSLTPPIQFIETPPDFRQVSSTDVRKKVAQLRELEKELHALTPPEVYPLL